MSTVAAQDHPLQPDSAPLTLSQTIPLPDIQGSMNHLDADTKRERLFVTVPGEQKLVVVDLKAEKVQRVVADLPAAAARFIPGLDQLCVSGPSGVAFYAGDSLALLGKVDMNAIVDELQYDAKEKRVYAGLMDADQLGIAAIDVAKRTLVSKWKLPAKPQGFVVEQQGTRIYVNTPAAKKVTVIDRQQPSAVAEWTLAEAKSNYPIALDEANHRLFVACRIPAKLLVLDTTSGQTVTSAEIGTDADDMSFDPAGKCIYVACGGGVISTIKQTDPDHYQKLADTPTPSNSRNSLLVAPLKLFYLAVPRKGETPAELRGYRLRD